MKGRVSSEAAQAIERDKDRKPGRGASGRLLSAKPTLSIRSTDDSGFTVRPGVVP
jgi:hypothetical protein